MKVKQYFDSYILNFESAKNTWNYEDGCVLLGASMLYKATNNEDYKTFVIEYMNNYINDDGTINTFEKDNYNIDNINTGKVLFFLYDETQEEKYLLAIQTIQNQIKTSPRTNSNNFWHKKIYPNQVWLDGLYMALPFYMEYETRFNKKENYRDIIHQFENVKKYLYHSEKQLYYHGYDESREQPWADKVTGVSKSFWLRSMGWLVMALIDTMDAMSEEIFEHYKTLEGLFKESIKGLLLYQDKESKLFYQVIDRSDIKENYLETSGSVMIAYAILKGCRLGVLQNEKYQYIGEEILESIIDTKLTVIDEDVKLCDICSVAGLGPENDRDGSVDYYLSEPVVCNDHKGTGAFMMAYAQLLQLTGTKN